MNFKGSGIGLVNCAPLKLFTFLFLSIALTSCQASNNDSKITAKADNSPIEIQATPTANPSEAEVELYVRAVSLGQQAYFLQNNKFTSTIEEMGIGNVPPTESYNLTIPVAEKKQSKITATAKKQGLKSYTASVFVMDEKIGTTMGIICGTDKPSPNPPEMPTAPKSFAEKPKCPPGSYEVVAKPNL